MIWDAISFIKQIVTHECVMHYWTVFAESNGVTRAMWKQQPPTQQLQSCLSWVTGRRELSNSQCGLGVACYGWNIWSVLSPHVEPDGSVCLRWLEVLRREQMHIVTHILKTAANTMYSLVARENHRNLFETRKDPVLFCYDWHFSHY